MRGIESPPPCSFQSRTTKECPPNWDEWHQECRGGAQLGEGASGDVVMASAWSVLCGIRTLFVMSRRAFLNTELQMPQIPPGGPAHTSHRESHRTSLMAEHAHGLVSSTLRSLSVGTNFCQIPVSPYHLIHATYGLGKVNLHRERSIYIKLC